MSILTIPCGKCGRGKAGKPLPLFSCARQWSNCHERRTNHNHAPYSLQLGYHRGHRPHSPTHPANNSEKPAHIAQVMATVLSFDSHHHPPHSTYSLSLSIFYLFLFFPFFPLGGEQSLKCWRKVNSGHTSRHGQP